MASLVGSLSGKTHAIGEDNLRKNALILRVGVFEIGVGFLQFGLTVFHHRSETQRVAGLGKIEGQTGLLPQLPRECKALVGFPGVQLGNANITGNIIL